jgi:hypothetical protein
MPSLVSEPTLGIPALNPIAMAGWAIVATDYSSAKKDGPHPFLIGEGEARAGLDSVSGCADNDSNTANSPITTTPTLCALAQRWRSR